MTESMETVREAQARAERVTALKTLLRHPLITAHGKHADTFVLIRRHAQELASWFKETANWTLYVDSETARLHKYPADLHDTTRGAPTKTRFSPRHYALFCLALAALTQGERQTTLGRLFENIVQLSAVDPQFAALGLQLDPSVRDHRRDLVYATSLMLELDLIHKVDGDEKAYLEGDEGGDVLYTVNRSALTWALSVRRSPATVQATNFQERLEAITSQPEPQTEEARRKATRIYLNRKLLDDPVLYYDDLEPQQAAYLTHQRSRIRDHLEAITDLHLELREEGLALADLSGDLTDVDFPSEGTEGHITLLTADYFASSLRQVGPEPISFQELLANLSELAETYRAYWRKGSDQPEILGELLHIAIDRLRALNLIIKDSGGYRPRAAIARFHLKTKDSDNT